jgi:predicted transcriptional regulator
MYAQAMVHKKYVNRTRFPVDNPELAAIFRLVPETDPFAEENIMPSCPPADLIVEARIAALAFIAQNPGIGADAVVEFVLNRLNPPRTLAPAVPIEQSITPDERFIFCLVDGKKLRMLKRYIKRFDMTPDSYREAFGLDADYPMTAPAYSDQKRKEAERVGLGSDENKAGLNRRLRAKPRRKTARATTARVLEAA